MTEAIIAVLALLCVVSIAMWARSISSRIKAEKAVETANQSNKILQTKYKLQVERNRVIRDELKAKVKKDLETRSPGDVLDDFVNARSVHKDED